MPASEHLPTPGDVPQDVRMSGCRMPWTYGKSLLTTTAIVAVFLCASTPRGVGGVAFVHTYSNGDVGIEGIGGPRALAMSPDGATLYVSSVSSDDGPTIGVFQRDMTTGRLTEVQVVHPDFCTGIVPGSISVSPDVRARR